ncbi:MAG: hypothetical protein UIQ67_05955 [Bacteroidales bacterium]|nr:hypothetical protein [Bacteroidales bacterium]
MKQLTTQEFCSKSRYLYEIADYLGLRRTTLRIWIQDTEELSDILNRKRLLYSPKEVERIVKYFGVISE